MAATRAATPSPATAGAEIAAAEPPKVWEVVQTFFADGEGEKERERGEGREVRGKEEASQLVGHFRVD